MWPDLCSNCGSCSKSGKGMTTQQRHCAKNLKQILPEMKLRSLVPNSFIHVSLSGLCIPTISGCSQIGGLIVGIYKSLTDTRTWKLNMRPHSFISGNTSKEFCLQCRGHLNMMQRGKQASVAKFLATKMLSSTEGGWRWKGGYVMTTSVGCGKFLLF